MSPRRLTLQETMMRTFHIYRYDPDVDDKPRMQIMEGKSVV